MAAAEECRLLEADVSPSNVSTFKPKIHEDTLLAYWDPFIKHAARRAVFFLGWGQHEAEDLAQEMRIRVFLAIRRYQELPPSYFHETIRNSIRSTIRTRTRAFEPHLSQIEVMEEDLEDARSFVDDDIIPRLTVGAWVAGLSPSLKVLHELLYVQECTQREAASIMKISQPRVAQLHRDLLEEGRRNLADLAA